jgi:assimilatory nitrate reductase catalytic subunit
LLAGAGTADGIRALLIFGSNPAVSAPDAQTIASRLRSLDLLVVSDFFLSESAALADVVLPAAQWAEEDGTVTNLEGRVIGRRKAMDPPALVRSDIEVLSELGRRLGKSGQFDFATSEDVFSELRRASAGGPADYSGITYERIDVEDGVFWPCPAEDHPGTPRMFSAGFPTPSGQAQFHAVRHQAPAEQTDAEYPLHLTTGRVLAHYQSGNQTRRIASLNQAAGVPFAEMHPSTAARYGLSDGGRVSIQTRRGLASFAVKLAPGIRRDTVFVPFHWGGDALANTLTNPALDPISRMPEFKVCAARVTPAMERVVQARQPGSSPVSSSEE